MSHSFKIAKLIKNHQVGKSASSKSLSRRLGDRPRHLGGIANVATGTFAGLMGRRWGGYCSLALSLALATLVLPVFLSGASVYATSSSLSVSVSAGSGAYVNIPPTAEGKFGSAGPVTFSVSTNHASGYTLTAVATGLSFKDTEGANGDAGAVYTIDNLALPTGVTSISEDEFAGNAGYKNRWGYLPDKYYDSNAGGAVTGNVNYFPAPIDAAQTLDVTASANDPSSGGEANEYNVTIGTKLDHTVAQGAYTTTFTLAATVNPTPYTITYNANAGSDAVTNMPTVQTGDVDGEYAIISNSIPIRIGYIFSGWCTTRTTDGTGKAAPDCSGTNGIVYDVGGNFGLDQTAANEITLYAMWDVDPCRDRVLLHDLVTCQVKKDSSGSELTQTLEDMRAVITRPTSPNPRTDTSNSGVYLYDADYYGKANDGLDEMEDTENIYYFRGILDNVFVENDRYGGVPSAGDSGYYHNYVRLHDSSSDRSDTCWRIVRTTATGGTKMVYNGVWVESSCANANSNATAGNAYYNRGALDNPADYYGTSGFVVYVGYIYNDKYAYNNTQYTAAVSDGELFRNVNNDGATASSNLQEQIDAWYDGASNLDGYSDNSKLEDSAGWCNDRDLGDNGTIPYAMENTIFRAYTRNTWGKASLKCSNATGYDLLTLSNGLNYPAAPLTEDEVTLAGSGYMFYSKPQNDPTTPATMASNWGYSSYLRSGGNYWLVSPYGRMSGNGRVLMFQFHAAGGSFEGDIKDELGVRPTVSLVAGTTVSGGSGTATDPWVVEP